ncbi:MAG: GNAT family N-acetyltransferase [Dehalococcoidales bacterium]|nr:GNAT family N-acetyltransferase [Dehalococcoidales bacterium]
MPFTVKPASLKEKTIIHTLIQPYLFELSRFPDEHAEYGNKSGIYLYPYLDAYWQEKERLPYLLYSEGILAGFALVRKDGDHWEMAEFYIKPEFRRRGLGEYSAAVLFEKHFGLWKISYNKHNVASQNLWNKLAIRFTKDDIKKGKMDASHDYLVFQV